jgi:hypothetical protein
LKSTLGHDGPAFTVVSVTLAWPVLLLFWASVALHVSESVPELEGVYV